MGAILLVLLLTTGAFAQQWAELATSGPRPTPRNNASAVYDPIGHRLVVFGGRSADGDLNDLYALDLNTRVWSELTPPEPLPPLRSTHNAVYDPAAHQMLVWSGRLRGLFYNDVWALDLATDTWSTFEPADPKPNIRYGTGAVFDPVSMRLVTFAGFTEEGRFDDTWAFHPATATWTDLDLADNPGRRCLHTASYDPLNRRMIVYGGQRNGNLGDLWSLDLASNVWTEHTPADSPLGRNFPASVYDEHGDRFIIFGGGGAAGRKYGETWSFDFVKGAWEQIATDGDAPVARNGAAGVYLQSESRALFFGGVGTDARFNDVWALEGLAPTPTPTAVEAASWGEVKNQRR